MPNITTHRRTNLFALLLWVAALLLVATGLVLRQIGISAYAAAYANSSTAADALEYYSSVINSQYMVELGNGLVVAGCLAVVIALFFHALSALHRPDALVGVANDPALAEIAALLEDDEPDVFSPAEEASEIEEIDPAAPDSTESLAEPETDPGEETEIDDAVVDGAADTVTEVAIDGVADDDERR